MPYFYFSGVLFILIGGLLNLSALSSDLLFSSLGLYDRNLANNLFIIGIILVTLFLTFRKVFNMDVMINSSLLDTKEDQFFSRDKIQSGLQELWKCRKKPIEILFLGTIISLVAFVFINSELAFRLIFLLGFIAVFTYSFIRIIIFEDLEDKEDENKPEPPVKLSWWLRLIDYRSQPISISLVLFIIVILSYHTFDYYTINLEGTSLGSNNIHEFTLPMALSMLIFPILVSSFIYISHNYNFVGFRQVIPSKENITSVHFFELIVTGVTLFIWIISIITAI